MTAVGNGGTNPARLWLKAVTEAWIELLLTYRVCALVDCALVDCYQQKHAQLWPWLQQAENKKVDDFQQHEYNYTLVHFDTIALSHLRL